MIVTARVTANFRALTMLSPRKERQIVHREKNSALRRFQSVARVRQCARNDDRHRVIEERPRHFFSDVDRLYFFVGVKHYAVSAFSHSARKTMFVAVRCNAYASNCGGIVRISV